MSKKPAKTENALMKRLAITLADESGEWLLHENPAPRLSDTKSEDIDLYNSFAKKAASIARLSEKEEEDLGYRMQKIGDRLAAKILVQHNMRLAIKIAHQYRRSWTSLMDLVQEALAGLAIAAQKWDPSQQTRFGTYAAFWIRAQLTRFLMTNGRLIHTANTRAGRKIYFNLPIVRRKLLAAGENASVERIAEELGEDPKEVALVLARLDAKETRISGTSEDSNFEEKLAAHTKNPEQIAIQNEIETVVKHLVSDFEKTLDSERDKAIWREHLTANEPLSLVDLGAQYKVSKQRMGQLANRIKKNFRCFIIDHLGPNTQLSWLFSVDAE